MTDNLELEETLWQAADKLRNNMDAAEYKHVVLGLIFLKYISDAFDELYNHLETTKHETGADPEDKDEYTAERVFYVPPSARWKWLQGRAKLPTIGKDIDDAMDSIEKDNPSLKGVLPKDYARPALDKQRLGELIDLIGSIALSKGGNGKGKDVLGFVFEYFLGQFADAEGKKGGQFYIPQSIVKILVDMPAPEPEKRVYDGCCGSGGMFVQSEKFIELHEHRKGKISIFGQESNPTTYKLAKMNLAIRGIDAKIELGDTRELGTMISRKQKELSETDIAKISDIYHKWRSKDQFPKYKDVAGFCKSANIQDIRKNNYILTPGRYIDFKEVEDDGEAFEEKMKKLTETLTKQMENSLILDQEIRTNLAKIGFNI